MGQYLVLLFSINYLILAVSNFDPYPYVASGVIKRCGPLENPRTDGKARHG